MASFLPPFCNSSLETSVEINSSDHYACNPRCSAKDMLAGVHPETRSPCIPSPGACTAEPPMRATVVPEDRVSAGSESIKAKHRARARLERMLVVAAGTALSPIRAHVGIPDRTLGVKPPAQTDVLCSVSLMPHTRHSFLARSPSKPLSGAFPSRDAYVALDTLPASLYPLALHATPRRVSSGGRSRISPSPFSTKREIEILDIPKEQHLVFFLLICETPGRIRWWSGRFVICRPRISSAATNAAPLTN